MWKTTLVLTFTLECKIVCSTWRIEEIHFLKQIQQHLWRKEDNSRSIEVSWGAEVSVNLLLNRIYVVFRSAGDTLHFSWPPANLRLSYYFSLLQNSCRIPISRQVSVACYTWETGLWFSWIPFQNFEVKFCLYPPFPESEHHIFSVVINFGLFGSTCGWRKDPCNVWRWAERFRNCLFVTGWYSWSLMWKQWCSFWKNQNLLKAKQPLVFSLSMV